MKKKLVATGAGAALVSAVLLTVPLSGAAAKPDPAGDAKSNEVGALAQRIGTPVSVPPGTNRVAVVTCPAGTIITGGGGTTSAFDIFFTDSFASGNGWAIRGSNRGTTTQSITAVAMCMG